MAWVAAALAIDGGERSACRQLVGIGDEPPTGPVASSDAGAEAGFTYGQEGCATCVTTSCGPQETACAGTPSCAALEGCMSSCGTDPTCRAQCGVDHGLGNDGATPAFEACLAGSSCKDGVRDHVRRPGRGVSRGDGDCVRGVHRWQDVCAAVTGCAGDPLCQAALRCQFSNDTLDVWEACPQLPGQDAGANSTMFSQNPPIASSCASECAWGADWSCVGRVNWPPATLGPIAMTVNVYDILTGAPFVGATVKLCNVGDTMCTNPFTTGVTGEDGTVTLSRASVPVPVVHYIDISSGAIDELIELLSFPLSEPKVTIPAPAFQRGLNATLASSIGVELAAGLGELAVTAVDCRLAVAPGVQCSLAPQGGAAGPFYAQPGGIVVDAGSTQRPGIAVFFNVAPAPATLTLTLTVLGRASATMPVFARDGGESIVYAPPTP